MEGISINWLAVVVAALSSFPVGFLWYGPLFGKAWQKHVGLDAEAAARANKGVMFGAAFVLAFVQAASFAFFLGPTPFPFSALYGLVAGLCWVGAAFGVQYLFEAKSWKLSLINAGYNTVVFTLIGAIIGAWH
ncbi:DUF1761 domain-containing protein [Terricaulis sp.]|uniref:DUF1761 domain-containing protein n=1 Tax=Terricaulis sp. TaxID=2768686 RepID=UPI003782EB7E